MLKRLSLTFTVALALACSIGVSASSAATGLLASEYPAAYLGEPNRPNEYGESYLRYPAGTCALSPESLSGPKFQSNTFAQPTVALEPKFKPNASCQRNGQYATISMNGCTFDLTPSNSTFDIGPEGCGPIKFQWPECAGYLYPAANRSATYTNQTSTVFAGLTAKELKFDMKQCNANVYTGVEYYGGWKVSAYTEHGPVGLQLGTIPGMYLVGLQGDPPRIGAETANFKFTDSGAKSSAFKFISGEVKCSSTHYHGTLPAEEPGLVVEPTFEGCSTIFGGTGEAIATTAVAPSTCAYGLTLGTTSFPYTATMSVVGCGNGLEYQVHNGPSGSVGCTVKIYNQLNFFGGGITMENVHLTTGTGIELNFGSKASYNLSGSNCMAESKGYSGGVITGSTSVGR